MNISCLADFYNDVFCLILLKYIYSVLSTGCEGDNSFIYPMTGSISVGISWGNGPYQGFDERASCILYSYSVNNFYIMHIINV